MLILLILGMLLFTFYFAQRFNSMKAIIDAIVSAVILMISLIIVGIMAAWLVSVLASLDWLSIVKSIGITILAVFAICIIIACLRQIHQYWQQLKKQKQLQADIVQLRQDVIKQHPAKQLPSAAEPPNKQTRTTQPTDSRPNQLSPWQNITLLATVILVILVWIAEWTLPDSWHESYFIPFLALFVLPYFIIATLYLFWLAIKRLFTRA